MKRYCENCQVRMPALYCARCSHPTVKIRDVNIRRIPHHPGIRVFAEEHQLYPTQRRRHYPAAD